MQPTVSSREEGLGGGGGGGKSMGGRMLKLNAARNKLSENDIVEPSLQLPSQMPLALFHLMCKKVSLLLLQVPN